MDRERTSMRIELEVLNSFDLIITTSMSWTEREEAYEAVKAARSGAGSQAYKLKCSSNKPPTRGDNTRSAQRGAWVTTLSTIEVSASTDAEWPVMQCRALQHIAPFTPKDSKRSFIKRKSATSNQHQKSIAAITNSQNMNQRSSISNGQSEYLWIVATTTAIGV